MRPNQPQIANYANKAIFTSGRGGPDFKIVEMYDIKNDAWSFAPSMNVGRSKHTSLVVGQMIYNFLGWSFAKRGESRLDSLERLDAEAHINGESVEWQLIDLNLTSSFGLNPNRDN